MAQFYTVLMQDQPGKPAATVFWKAYHQREHAVTQCLSWAKIRRDEYAKKGQKVTIEKLQSPLVDMDTHETTMQTDGFLVKTTGFTGKYTVALINGFADQSLTTASAAGSQPQADN